MGERVVEQFYVESTESFRTLAELVVENMDERESTMEVSLALSLLTMVDAYEHAREHPYPITVVDP